MLQNPCLIADLSPKKRRGGAECRQGVKNKDEKFTFLISWR
jgi:hypothetical protein